MRLLLTGGLVLGFLVLVGVAGASAWLVSRDQDYTEWVNHTYTVERHLSRFGILFERAEAAERGYLLTRGPDFMRTYHQAASGLHDELETVQALTADNPVQQRNVAEMEPLLAQNLDALGAAFQGAEASEGAPQGLASKLNGDQVLVERTRSLLEAMVGEENRLLERRTELQGDNAQLLLWAVIGSGVLLTLIAGGSLFLIRRYAADLGRSEGALRALNEGLEQSVRERTAELTRANDEIQRFAYIVSHDLRSPLVNVMGFTSELEVGLKLLQQQLQRVADQAPQLLVPNARSAAEQDLPEAIGFIRSSTRKMDRLINAILKLSREGRRTLSAEPLDMDALLRGVAETLKHQADERGAEIVILAPLPGLTNDRLAMEQVFGNLIENALKYLKPGRPGRVSVSGREVGPIMIYEVADNGRGVDPKDHERIFELFRRSGAQDQPGEGIGLAHVRALMYRLGGSITVESALDQGATFRLSLPKTLLRDEGPQT